MMEHSRDYYQSFVTFLETVRDERCRYYTYERGIEIAGEYWMAICQDFAEKNLASIDYGNMQIFQLPPLAPILADCKDIIREIDRIDRDRRLENAEKRVAIFCGIAGFVISLIALYFSLKAA